MGLNSGQIEFSQERMGGGENCKEDPNQRVAREGSHQETDLQQNLGLVLIHPDDLVSSGLLLQDWLISSHTSKRPDMSLNFKKINNPFSIKTVIG